MSRESLSARIQRGPDDGGALVAVIGIMVVLTILVTTIVTTSLFNVRMTTETRAGVQARAAAEAGVDYVRAQIASGKCTTGTVTSPSGSPKFTVTIHPSSTGTATSSLPAGCPTASSKSVVLLAKGGAASSGVGSSNGNVRTVEALIESKTSSAPVFNAAIFAGTGAGLNVLNLSGTDADVVTNGSWYCSTQQTISGSIYAAKDVTFQSGPCGVTGSVFAGGKFTCTSPSSIGKNLYVQGDAVMQSVHCAAGGDVAIGGDAIPAQGIKAGGSLTVGRDLDQMWDKLEVAGAINVGGRIAGGSGDQYSWYGKFMAQYPSARQGQVVAKPPSGESATNMVFPRLTQSDEIWKGFSQKSWKTMTEPLRAQNERGMSVCAMSGGDKAIESPLEIRENTVFDVTPAAECGGRLAVGSGLTLRLGGDVVIFADQFSMTGNVRVESLDGKNHSLYIVTPHPAAQTSCAAPVGNSKISFDWGSWSQDDKTSVMLYSSGEVYINPATTMRGQIYSCKFTAVNPLSLFFVKSGASSSDPSASKPALKYVRDVAG